MPQSMLVLVAVVVDDVACDQLGLLLHRHYHFPGNDDVFLIGAKVVINWVMQSSDPYQKVSSSSEELIDC